MVGNAFGEATGKKQKKAKNDVSDRDVVVLGSGNLGLIYLMEERRRLTLEEINERHPELIPALRAHPHVGWLLVRSSEHGAVALGANGTHYLAQGRVEGDDPLAHFSPHAPQHLLRTDGFQHVGDIMVGSFYDPDLDEGCAFEELISFHGGIGGLQTRPFILHPTHLEVPRGPILGAASVHGILAGWRQQLQNGGHGEESPVAELAGRGRRRANRRGTGRLTQARALPLARSAQLRSTAKSRCEPSSPFNSTSRLSTNSIPGPATSSRTRLETSTSPPRAWLATRAA